jgi:holo-[acyl-carrier protein] synthase
MSDGVGTDIVSVPRIAALIRDGGQTFLRRWFTPEEIAYCSGKAAPSRHFAARMAAKEAVMKALPTVWDGPLPWRSIEIVHIPGGAPTVRLSGDFLAASLRAGVGDIRVSLSHCDEFATAVALVTLASRPGAAQPRNGGLRTDSQQIDHVLREWETLRDPDLDPELEAVRGAVLLEDVLGVTLADDEIDLAVLSDPDAVERLLARRGSGL